MTIDADPIWIACEGSRCPTHWRDHNEGICQMCGQLVRTGGDGRAANHQRKDIIAMLDRGDFG